MRSPLVIVDTRKSDISYNTEVEDKKTKNTKILQMIISQNSYLGRLPPSANRNNFGVQWNVDPPLNNKRKVL